MREWMKSPWFLGSLLITAVLVVLFLILCANPSLYAISLARALDPPIEPATVRDISATLPDDPESIEEWVRREIVFDANDYAGWGVILYIATPREVLERGRGPCYARAVVLASILEEKGLQYRLMANMVHVWVDYAGRQPKHWHERPEYAAFSWNEEQWHFEGMGWVIAAPRQAVWLAKHLWHTTSWVQKAMLSAMIAVTIGLQWRIWRRQESGH